MGIVNLIPCCRPRWDFKKVGEDAMKGDHWVLGERKKHTLVSNPRKLKNKNIIIMLWKFMRNQKLMCQIIMKSTKRTKSQKSFGFTL
jgi:hypothetical protein